LVVADLRVRVAFELFFAVAMSAQYSQWFARFNIGQLGIAGAMHACS
jgi:hypothetical protein